MKKLGIYFLFNSLVFGLGGIEISTTHTVGGVANPAQTAVVSADAPFYNPAASLFLGDGEFLSFGISGVFPKYTIKYHGQDVLKTTTPQPLPSFAYTINTGNIGYFIAMGSLGQGGFLKYDASYDVVNKLDITAFNPGIITGISYKFKENLSGAIALRGIYSRLEVKGDTVSGLEVDSKIRAYGVTPEFSVFYKPTEKLDLGAKFLFRTKLDYRGKVMKDDAGIAKTYLAKYSRDQRKDFPSVLSLGSGYQLTEQDKIFLGVNFIFERDKKFTDDLYEKYKNTYEYLAGYERNLNSSFDLILGYGYTYKGKNSEPVADMTQLSAQSISSGLRYKYDSDTNILLALGGNFYKSNSTINRLSKEKRKIDTTRREIILGVSIEKRF